MSVLARLFSRDAAFDRVILVLRSRKVQALPALVRLLKQRSQPDVATTRARNLDALAARGLTVPVFNGGGTRARSRNAPKCPASAAGSAQ